MVKTYAQIIVLMIGINSTSCSFSRDESAYSERLRILMDSPPATLNPRRTLDAAGQRINALLFRALTRLDENLEPQPDLAESWKMFDGGRTWKFAIRADLKDHQHRSIGAQEILECLENYRAGEPYSPLRESFLSWVRTELGPDRKSVILRLSQPDPYLLRNLSLLRFYQDATGSEKPCAELKDDTIPISNGLYAPNIWTLNPESSFELNSHVTNRRSLRLLFVNDENTKAIYLLRGEADVTQNAIGLSKTKLAKDHLQSRYSVVERDGVSVAYLAFNMRDPILSKLAVRRAIALAIDRELIISTKLDGYAKLAGSFLSPLLPESFQTEMKSEPNQSSRVLEQAGFMKNKAGIFFQLHYKTTPSREGLEMAQIFQQMLKRIGVELIIDVVEPAVFFSSIRKGSFQLYSSRWVGVADGSILSRTLHTGQLTNRVGYVNPEMDALLDRASREMSLTQRKEILREIQSLMAKDMPYFPLWYWKNTVIFNKKLRGLDPGQISLSGALEPITRLR